MHLAANKKPEAGGVILNTHEQMETNVVAPKVIKRYQNRKLYDTQQSCYVTLDDISRMIKAQEKVTVVDNKTKRDITASTLTQIIFEAEKKAALFAPLKVLREIIQNDNGSISSYLAKLEVFTREDTPKPVEHEYVKDLIEKGSRSPSGYGKNQNLQPASNQNTKYNRSSVLSDDDSPTQLTPGIRPMSPDSLTDELPSSTTDVD